MYSSIKLPPPFWPHIQGNFHTLPQPMAQPADSMMKPSRLPSRSRFCINLYCFLPFLFVLPRGKRQRPARQHR